MYFKNTVFHLQKSDLLHVVLPYCFLSSQINIRNLSELETEPELGAELVAVTYLLHLPFLTHLRQIDISDISAFWSKRSSFGRLDFFTFTCIHITHAANPPTQKEDGFLSTVCSSDPSSEQNGGFNPLSLLANLGWQAVRPLVAVNIVQRPAVVKLNWMKLSRWDRLLCVDLLAPPPPPEPGSKPPDGVCHF